MDTHISSALKTWTKEKNQRCWRIEFWLPTCVHTHKSDWRAWDWIIKVTEEHEIGSCWSCIRSSRAFTLSYISCTRSLDYHLIRKLDKPMDSYQFKIIQNMERKTAHKVPFFDKYGVSPWNKKFQSIHYLD